MEGKTIGNYRILEKIGAGGMGAVFLARDNSLEREVAIKIISPELARIPHLMARFRVEAIAQARLNHPNIVTIHAFDHQEETFYIVMEYVAGKTLKQLIAEKGKIPVQQALTITSHLLAGLVYAHARGVLHRDIKPANIFVNTDDNAKIADFGIAKVKGIDGLTRVGSTLGTLLYSAPEQIRGEKVNAAADIYSLGVTLYEMVVGRPPFSSSSGSNYEIQLGHLEKTPPVPSSQNSTIPPALDAIIMKSLAKLPSARFAGSDEFKESVDRLLHPGAGGKKASASAREKIISAFPEFKFSNLKFPKIKATAGDSSFSRKIGRKIPAVKQYLKSFSFSRSASPGSRTSFSGLGTLDKRKRMIIVIILVIFLLFIVVVFAQPPGGGGGVSTPRRHFVPSSGALNCAPGIINTFSEDRFSQDKVTPKPGGVPLPQEGPSDHLSTAQKRDFALNINSPETTITRSCGPAAPNRRNR